MKLKKLFPDALFLFCIFLLAPLYFYKLGQSSLVSWDEAWYGIISKNILKTGDFLNLVYNNEAYFDHPPLGFWLQALSMNFFGISEFAVRFPAAVLGLASLVVVYFLGKEMFNKEVGFFSALALSTSPWFLFRSRSGNLDIPLIFFFILSFYFALKSTQNSKYLILLFMSLSFLFLTKSLVPFTFIPTVFLILWKKIKPKDYIGPFLAFLLITIPWFLVNYAKHHELFTKYLQIGYPGVGTEAKIVDNIVQTKIYLHNGIGNWFWYGFLAIVLGTLFFRRKFLPIAIFIGVFLLPFAFSSRGHIWHLIPLHPFWFLSFFGFLGSLLGKANKKIVLPIFIIFLVWISYPQVKRNWYEIIDSPTYTSDIETLATRSKDYDLPLHLDDDAIPEALFYSEKVRVEKVGGRGALLGMFEGKQEFLLITRNWRIEEEQIKPEYYEVLASDRDKILVKSIPFR